MGHKKGVDRREGLLMPEFVDDLIGSDNPVRAIDAFVESLDLQKLKFKYAQASETGRPPYDPSDMLRLYIYGYLEGINTSRKLAAETKKNLEVMWLLCKLTPDFRTIANFRSDNKVALLAVFYEFGRICKREGLFGGKLVGLDGSKMQASNSKDNNFSKKKLEELLQYYDQKIDAYLKQLDQNDLVEQNQETAETKEELQKKLENIKNRKEDKTKLLEELNKSGEKQISKVDPESRRMKAGDGTKISYNVQIAVDEENRLILDFDVTNEGNDLHQLYKMSSRACRILETTDVKIAADTGFHSAAEIVACEKAGIEVYVSRPKFHQSDVFSKEQFIYDQENDTYLCPAGSRMTRRADVHEHGRVLQAYQTNDCKSCSLRSGCTKSKNRNRQITRFPDEHLLESAELRSQNNPDIRTRRKALVEAPFGTVKTQINHGRFVTRGKTKVTAEMALAFLAYNFKRAIKVLTTRGTLWRKSVLAGFDRQIDLLTSNISLKSNFSAGRHPYCLSRA